jgi:predicted ferric reductase
MTGDDILDIVGGKEELRRRAIFMCGPPGMMEQLSKDLHRKGVPYRNIIYEDFDMLD